MPSITYNTGIPFATHNPSDDQPLMLTNNDANPVIWGVDHNTFSSVDAGTHQFVTLPNYLSPVPAQTGTRSLVYTEAGTLSTHPNLLYKNTDSSYLLSAIKAFIAFKPAAGGNTILTNFNFASVAGAGTGPYTVKLNANVVTGNNICAIVNQSGVSGSATGAALTWSFTNPDITLPAGSGLSNLSNNIINIIVLQF